MTPSKLRRGDAITLLPSGEQSTVSAVFLHCFKARDHMLAIRFDEEYDAVTNPSGKWAKNERTKTP